MRDHCQMPRCARHLGDHEPRICHRCVGKVREHLERIQTLCAWAPVVAATASLDSAEVALAGPVADPNTHAARRRWAMRGGLCRCERCPDLEPTPEGPACKDWRTCKHHTCRRIVGRPTCPDLLAWLDNADDERHPLWVLGGWDLLVAEHFGHRRTMRVTIGGASGYLTANLTDLARHEDFAFDELAREVKGCVEHVENVLALALRQQRGAPCPVCYQSGRQAKPLVREYAEDEPDDSLDTWVCPRSECGEVWTVEQYDKYVERGHREQADRLTARAMAAEYRISEGSIRGWASKGLIRKRGRDQQGLTLYDVTDTLRVRDGARLRSA